MGGTLNEIKFEVESITPLFIAGADQRNIENEGLRPPSLRGLLRWWFRALAGSFVGDIQSLKVIESKVFGSTTSKSKVIIKTLERNSKLQSMGFKQVGFFKRLTRSYYEPKSKFCVSISAKSEMEELKPAIASFWALIYLGGIGYRSRKGGGCFRIISSGNNLSDLKLEFSPKENNNREAFKEFLANNIKEARSTIKNYINNSSSSLQPTYPTLDPNHSVLVIGKNQSSWENALNECYNWYKLHRDKNQTNRSSPFRFGVYKLDNEFIPRILIFKFGAFAEKYNQLINELKNDSWEIVWGGKNE